MRDNTSIRRTGRIDSGEPNRTHSVAESGRKPRQQCGIPRSMLRQRVPTRAKVATIGTRGIHDTLVQRSPEGHNDRGDGAAGDERTRRESHIEPPSHREHGDEAMTGDATSQMATMPYINNHSHECGIANQNSPLYVA